MKNHFYETPALYNKALNESEIIAGKDILESYPRTVLLDTGNICNQFCKFCQSRKAKQQPVILKPKDYENFTWLKFVEEIFFAGNYGDVLANEHFYDICTTVRRQAPYSTYSLWSNGLGLQGKNLDISIDMMSNIFLSQNAVSESVYNTVIHGGNYRQSRKNLEALSKRRPAGMTVTLMMVLIKETAQEIEAFINLAAELNFQRVLVHHGEFVPTPQSPEKALQEDSFLTDYSAYFDNKALYSFAKNKNIAFNLGSYTAYQGNHTCHLPYTQAYLGILRNRPAFDVCCASLGRPLLFAENFNNFRDFKKYWNHPRVQELRIFGNNATQRHPMCARCKEERISPRLTIPEIRKCITKYNLQGYDEWGFRFFEDITL